MHPFSLSTSHRNSWKLLCCFLFLIGSLAVGLAEGLAKETRKAAPGNVLQNVMFSQEDTRQTIRIRGTAKPTYTVYELFNPARIIVDVAEASFAEGGSFTLPKKSGIRLQTRTVNKSQPPICRFEFTLARSGSFKVRDEGNDIVLDLQAGQPPAPAEKTAKKQATGSGSARLSKIEVSTKGTETRVLLAVNGRIPDFKYDVLGRDAANPPRLYIDINNIDGQGLLREQKVGTALARIRVAKRGSGLRVVFDGAGETLFPFQVKRSEHGILVTIREKGKQDAISSVITKKETIEAQLPEIDLLQKTTAKKGEKPSAPQDSFAFAGYEKERITVDFYKIDLHNVFRLLREVSGMNIVVDESVSGSLTLALDDVPWDFALDIILNLKNLQKEERFNTIVILPRDKAFNWPQRTADNLSFETDTRVAAQEAIVIQQRQAMPRTVLEAKKLIAEGRKLEKRQDIETALKRYEEALKKWPDNGRLANKIATLYLVGLRQNAKALYFAEKALKADRKLRAAALNAAIALANMEENTRAQQYFDQSVSGAKPSREALLSYAVFAENQKQYSAARKLLKRYEKLYGQSLDSMVATARILDKEGQHESATGVYKRILLAGFRIPPDLKKFIQGRITLSQSM